MTDELTKACINLFAVLRGLEDLCEMDRESKLLISDKNITIQFSVRNGPKALLAIEGGKCTLKEGEGKCDIKLYFNSPAHFNAMFEGKANPIPLKGFTKIKFLTNEFKKLTDRLEFYMRPKDELLNDPAYFRINAFLTAYAAINAIVQIGNTDKLGKVNAARIPNGVISVSVLDDGPSINVTAKDGFLKAAKVAELPPRAYMIFSNIDVLYRMFNGKLDTYTAIGSGDFQIKGYIPMLDSMNKLLAQVPAYLK